MKNTLKLLKAGFESATVKTPQFLSFVKVFKRELNAILKDKWCTKIEFSIGHFYISGFFTSATGQIYYFSLMDVRGAEFSSQIRLMYRTAKDYKDYTGGGNQWANITYEGLEYFNLK